MQTGLNGFDAAIAARDAVAVSVDVPASGFGGNFTEAGGPGVVVEVTRELAGGLPEATTLIEGGAQSRVSVTLDAHMTEISPFVPEHQAAVLKSTIDVEAGFDGLKVPIFSGLVNEFGTDEGLRELTLSGRDATDRLTAPANVPIFGAYQTRLNPAAKRHPTNTQGIVTNILHTNGIRMTPPPRAGVVLSVPGVAGWLADVGWTMSALGDVPLAWLEPGRFGHAPRASGDQLVGYPSEAWAIASGRVVQLEAWVRHVPGVDRTNLLSLITDQAGFLGFDIEGDRVKAYSVQDPNPRHEVFSGGGTLSAGWHHIAVQFTIGTRVQIWVDGVLRQDALSSSWPSSMAIGIVEHVMWMSGGIQDVKMHFGLSAAAVSPPTPAVTTFSPEADVDLGMIDVETTPDLGSKTSWDALKEIAAAEFGMVGFSESGRFFFRNQATLSVVRDPVATWDFDEAQGIGGSVTLEGVRSTATAKRASAVLEYSGFGADSPQTIATPSYLADQVLEIKHGRQTFLLQGDPFVPLDVMVRNITFPGSAWETSVGWVLCRDRAGATRWTGTSADVAAWLSPVSAGVWRLTVINDSGFFLYPVWPKAWDVEGSSRFADLEAGAPALWINGLKRVALAETAETVRSAATAAAWGERAIDLGTSPYWQRPEVVRSLLTRLLAALGKPRAQLSEVTMPADPRWQIGDSIILHDPDGIVPDMRVAITRQKITISRGVESGMMGVYELRQVDGPTGVAPVVTTHPQPQSVFYGETATVSAAASGVPSPEVQWQRSTDNATWVDIPGATSPSYTTPPVESTYRLRAVFTNSAGDATSNVALIVAVD